MRHYVILSLLTTSVSNPIDSVVHPETVDFCLSYESMAQKVPLVPLTDFLPMIPDVLSVPLNS